jgi:hypothetical protein
MWGVSWVDEHSIAALAAVHNQLLNALLLAANRNKVKLLCGLLQLRSCLLAQSLIVCLRASSLWRKASPKCFDSLVIRDITLDRFRSGFGCHGLSNPKSGEALPDGPAGPPLPLGSEARRLGVRPQAANISYASVWPCSS